MGSNGVGKNNWGTYGLLNDVLVGPVSRNGEVTLLSHCEDLRSKKLAVSGLAKLIDVLGEDVGSEEQVSGSGVEGGDGVEVDVVEGSVDLEVGA